MKNWIRKNILAETPIIGGFFEEKGLSHALYHGAKDTFHLTGAAIAMILYMENNPMESDTTAHHAESSSQYYAKMVVYMKLGEMLGAVTFNTVSKVSQLGYNAYLIWDRRREEKKLIVQTHRSDDSPNSSL